MTGAVIRLDPHDNVVVCCRAVRAGEQLRIDDVDLVVGQDVDLGHKLALIPLEIGDKVFKYGMTIGSITTATAAGSWVHMHNMKSDYISAHTRLGPGERA
jgi:SAF domain